MAVDKYRPVSGENEIKLIRSAACFYEEYANKMPEFYADEPRLVEYYRTKGRDDAKHRAKILRIFLEEYDALRFHSAKNKPRGRTGQLRRPLGAESMETLYRRQDGQCVAAAMVRTAQSQYSL